jgi:hypothetical protein
MVKNLIKNIGYLKEQQKRCPKCYCAMYSVIDKYFPCYFFKMGKDTDRDYYFNPKKILVIEKTINPKNILLEKRDRATIYNNRKIKLPKTVIGRPVSKSVFLECPACRYYCYVYEKSQSF